MEDKEKNHIFMSLISKKRRLLELREVVKSKSPYNRLNDLEEQDVRCSETLFPNDLPSISPPPLTPITLEQKQINENKLQDERCFETLFPNDLPSISPPPFSPLTPLILKQKPTNGNKPQDEPNSDSENEISINMSSSPLLKNLDNDEPLSSPLRPMSPKTRELYNVLVERGVELPCYPDSNDDGVESPAFVIQNSKQAANDDSETDCESYVEDNTSTLEQHMNETGTKDTTEEGNTLETAADGQKADIDTENNAMQGIRVSTSDINVMPDTDENTTTTTEIEETREKGTKKNKKGRSRKERQKSKVLRNTGKSYINEKGKLVPERETKDLVACRLKCAERITENERKKCFEDYWKLGERDRRAAFVSKSIQILPKKSQRTDSVAIQRQYYCTYKLLFSHENRVVCKECFCRILGETKGFVNVVIDKKKQSPTGIIDTDQRGCNPPKNKKSIEDLSIVRNHICSFPSYESHYCRKSTGKKYLPADLSISKMYREYKTSLPNPVSLKLYAKVFHELNLSFKQPSKDTCNTCDVLNTKIKVADEDRKAQLITELTHHQDQAEKAYNEKRIDKDIAKDNSAIRAFAFDLQQCLPTPYLTTSVSFYKRQLWSFNLTIHDLSSNEATCYLWDETIGARGANQIASCLWHFCNALPPEVKEVIFYSDTCGGQNKNNIVAMMFLHLVKHHPTLEKISHKFLISGHTHMECDSDHAIIERTKKKTQMKINHLYDWVQLIRTCKVQKPFQVVVMTLEDFLDFSSLKSKKGPYSIKKFDDSGDKFLWQPVKWLQYTKADLGQINYKDNVDRDTQFQSINFKKRGKLNKEAFCLDQISKEPLAISAEKKKDLMDLLDLIDVSFRDFYINLKAINCKPSDPDIDEDDPDCED